MYFINSHSFYMFQKNKISSSSCLKPVAVLPGTPVLSRPRDACSFSVQLRCLERPSKYLSRFPHYLWLRKMFLPCYKS